LPGSFLKLSLLIDLDFITIGLFVVKIIILTPTSIFLDEAFLKKPVKTILWLLVALLALGLFVKSLRKGDVVETIKDVHWGWMVLTVMIYMLSQTILASRWVILLKVHGVVISFYQAVKLTYLGLFYNNMMPGAVGGDLLKGWYITRHSDEEQRLQAVVTVFVDRLVGLIGMILVAAMASLFVGPELAYRGIQIRWIVWGIFAAIVLLAIIFLSRRTRRLLLISRVLEKLPFAQKLKQIDDAIRIYRSHLMTMVRALVLTAILQGGAIVAVWILTRAVGLEQVSFWQCLIIMPIVWVISAAVPVPGGWGVMENCITFLFCLVINPDEPDSARAIGQAATLALLFRVVVCFCSLPGALVPLFGGHLPKQSEMEESMASVSESGSE
jgi:uncharacterized protein (TIRG00374 family)